MPKGLALTIGLNSVDQRHYDGWSGDLTACEADAQAMAEIAKSKGFEAKTLLTKQGTRDVVKIEISKAAAVLKAGDIFMLAYSGHGGQVPDINKDEKDYVDETWCLYDGQLIDDEANNLFSEFAEGVRILVFSDSCHSGTVVKGVFMDGSTSSRSSRISSKGARPKFLPREKARATYLKNKEFYDGILCGLKLKAVEASVLLISGCLDHQKSLDGTFNSLFTATLLKVWDNGGFKGTYKSFHQRILELMPQDQTPNYFWNGKPNPTFEAQEPFTI